MKMGNNRLVGKGGLGLVMFHLARHNIDFEQTGTDSQSGDLLVKMGDEMLPVEVKASGKLGWRVRLRQIKTARVFIFMSYEGSRCWIVSSNDVRAISETAKKVDDGVFLVYSRMFPKDSLHAWGRIEEIIGLPDPKRRLAKVRLEAIPQVEMKRMPVIGFSGTPRSVKKTLASGEVKTYHYPGRPIRGRKPVDSRLS